jgi:hypothetical protein
MVWGTTAAAAVPATTFWGLLLVGVVIGAVGVRALRGTRPRTLGVLGLALGLMMPIVARAVPPPNTFTNGTVADANLVNANFTAVSSISVNGVRYSVGATKYCGNTAASYGGAAMGGYAGAKSHCETVSGCGLSPTAHMCTQEEFERSAQLGITPTAPGWLAANAGSSDCIGWTFSGGGATGSYWTVLGNIGIDQCTNMHPILCCD